MNIVFNLHSTQVYLIGKDFGSRIVYLFSLLHPERVSGIITLGVPFSPPIRPSVVNHHSEGSYISRWQVQLLVFLFKKLNKTWMNSLCILFNSPGFRNVDEPRLISAGLTVEQWYETSTFFSQEVKCQQLLRARRLWILWIHPLLYPLGSLTKNLMYMPLSMRNLDSKLHCKFPIGKHGISFKAKLLQFLNIW